MFKKSLAAILLLSSLALEAHCPQGFKPEKVCLMLDQNVIYIYDEKLEHNGPYKDLATSSIETIKSEGAELKFARVARGIYRIEDKRPLKSLELVMINGKEKVKSHLKLKNE